MASGGLKVCLIMSLLLFNIVTFAVLFLIFKPKDPNITVHPVGLQHFEFSLLPTLTMNMSIDTLITIENPNYGCFDYTKSIGYVNFHDIIVGEVPIRANLVPGRSHIN
ncbi:uncharacterized protein LOC109794411, partial [Cajanus cajan]